MSLKIDVKGVNVVLKDLDRYSDNVKKEIVQEVKEWSERVESKAQTDVPVDTGALRSSIRAVGTQDTLTWIVKAGGINGVNYAPYIEFGTGAFVNQSFLQEFGLVNYARQFKGAGVKQVNLPQREFLYRNARTEFDKTRKNIIEILRKNGKG